MAQVTEERFAELKRLQGQGFVGYRPLRSSGRVPPDPQRPIPELAVAAPAANEGAVSALMRALRVSEVPRPVLFAIAALVALALVCGWVLHTQSASGTMVVRAGDSGTVEQNEGGFGETVVVHVAGAVVSPGLYEFDEGARVGDAVAAAGGLAEDADDSLINLAEGLRDGQRVFVPRAGQEGQAVAQSVGRDGAGALLDINAATAAELESLPGIGESTAQAIVRDREQRGPFSSIEDVMRVSGIGQKKFDGFSSLIVAL